jgi:phenylalanyl-tRNA synthetase alpha chain
MALNIELSALDKKVLLSLRSKYLSLQEIAKNCDLKPETAMLALLTLKEKGLVEIKEEKERIYSLSEEGRQYAVTGLPERQIHQFLITQGKSTIKTLMDKWGAEKPSIAIGWLKKKNWARFERKNGDIAILPLPAEKGSDEAMLELLYTKGRVRESELAQTQKDYLDALNALFKRNLIQVRGEKQIYARASEQGLFILQQGIAIEEEIKQLTPELISTDKWQGKSFQRYNVSAAAAIEYAGKKHVLRMAIDKVKRILVEMGFKEMQGPIVEAEFYVNDCLFMPQDHPARTQWDQFNLKKPRYIKQLPPRLVDRVKAAHENGGETGSEGWRYNWSEEAAKRLVLRGHTTSLTARYLKEYNTPPNKFFAVDKVFRNDSIDQTHLLEFYQIEGWVIDYNLSIRDLMGTFKEFYRKLGIHELKFKPTYNPYTEPSFEIYGKHPLTGKWMEIGNSGLFREEMLWPYGIDADVIAWGLALERILMLLYGFNDIRNLHGSLCDLEFLRSVPILWRQ